MKERERILPQEGPAAPPRANGELVFEAPWQSRIFGITLALLEDGRFAWPEFQSRLIEAIARHESARGNADYDYYACWLEAFRTLATDKSWLDPEALTKLEQDLAARPPAHDH